MGDSGRLLALQKYRKRIGGAEFYEFIPVIVIQRMLPIDRFIKLKQ